MVTSTCEEVLSEDGWWQFWLALRDVFGFEHLRCVLVLIQNGRIAIVLILALVQLLRCGSVEYLWGINHLPVLRATEPFSLLLRVSLVRVTEITLSLLLLLLLYSKHLPHILKLLPELKLH